MPLRQQQQQEAVAHKERARRRTREVGEHGLRQFQGELERLSISHAQQIHRLAPTLLSSPQARNDALSVVTDTGTRAATGAAAAATAAAQEAAQEAAIPFRRLDNQQATTLQRLAEEEATRIEREDEANQRISEGDLARQRPRAEEAEFDHRARSVERWRAKIDEERQPVEDEMEHAKLKEVDKKKWKGKDIEGEKPYYGYIMVDAPEAGVSLFPYLPLSPDASATPSLDLPSFLDHCLGPSPLTQTSPPIAKNLSKSLPQSPHPYHQLLFLPLQLALPPVLLPEHLRGAN